MYPAATRRCVRRSTCVTGCCRISTPCYGRPADDEPMLRPTFLDHEQDARTFGENDDFLIGRDLLVASVVEPGQRRRSVYLPDNGEGWYCFYSGQWFGGGQTVTLAAALERLPLLVRAGGAAAVAAAGACGCGRRRSA